jgi:hypothetical protein
MNKKFCLSFKRSVLVTFVALYATLARAAVATGSNTSDLSLSIGNLCEYIGKIQTDSKGSTNKCSFLPTLSTSLDYYLTPSWVLFPQIGATIPKSGTDENVKRMTMFTLINMKYKTTYANLIFGTGFYFTRIWGSGGEATLNNGNSTESYPLPKDAVWSRNVILNLGVSTDFNEQWSAELYTYIFNVDASEDRAFSAGASLSYHFGDIL